jgi:hypothetical protein
MLTKQINKLPLLLVLSCLTHWACAQGIDFPDDNQLDIADDRTDFCKPGVVNKSPGRGVLIEYTGVGGFGLRPRVGSSEGNEVSEVDYMEKFKGKFKIPLVNAPGLKMMLGYEYISETYHFDEIGDLNSSLFRALDDNTLKNNKFSFYLTKSINEKYYAGLRMRVSSRGDYEGWVSMDGRYTTFSATGLLGVKKSEDLEWGVGLTYSDNFVRKLVLPFAVYNQTFNDKWGIETVLPASILMRYNFDQKTLLLFGAELENGTYALDVVEDNRLGNTLPFYFRHTEIAMKGVFYKNILPWVWVEAEAGALIPVRSRFEDASDPLNLRFRNRTGVSPMLRVGIFLSPPKSMIK